MRLQSLVIFLAIGLVGCFAVDLNAQVMRSATSGFGSGGMRSARGSSTLSRFRRYSTGGDRFGGSALGGTAGPLAYNSRANVSAAAAMSFGSSRGGKRSPKRMNAATNRRLPRQNIRYRAPSLSVAKFGGLPVRGSSSKNVFSPPESFTSFNPKAGGPGGLNFLPDSLSKRGSFTARSFLPDAGGRARRDALSGILSPDRRKKGLADRRGGLPGQRRGRQRTAYSPQFPGQR